MTNMKLLAVFIVFGVTMADTHRSKRFLIFPPTSPTRMQLIAGIGIPVQLEYESVTFGYTFKAEYFLQDNMTIGNHFLRDPWNPIPHPIQNRRRRHALLLANQPMETHDPLEYETNKMETKSSTDDHYEKYDVEAIEVDSGLTGNDNEDDQEYYESENEEHEEPTPENNRNANPKDFSTARWTLFKGIELLAHRKGLPGRPCMLRSICESAQAPFSIKTGILGELMHIVMTPSLTKDTINEHSQNEYLRAEEIGRSGEPCDKVFKECTTSVLDQFSGIYNTMESLIKLFG